MRRGPRISAISTAVGLVLSASPALANGRFPSTGMLVSKPGDPSHLALRATYGVLLSSDSGANWDWICERAMGYGGSEDPSLLVTGSGAILVGTFQGVRRSTDGGCHFARDATWPVNVVDLTMRPKEPDRVYAVTSRFAAETDAGTTFTSQLFISKDAGLTWSLTSTIDPSLVLETVEVAPSDPARVYISAARPDGQHMNGALLESDDDGAHFVEHKISLRADETGVFIAAVDPKNAARVYLRTRSPDSGRVLSTGDAGKTVTQILSSEKNTLPGFALDGDGATIYAGGFGGVFRGAPKDPQLVQVSSTHVQCLSAIGSVLWACAPTSEGYVLGTSIDHGVKFTPKLTLSGMRGPLQCASPNDVDARQAEWPALRDLVGGSKETLPATLSSDKPADKPVEKPIAKKNWLGCAASPSSPQPISFAAVFVAIGALALAWIRAGSRPR